MIYQKCVDTVRLLASQHIPSWKWQSCVLSINNDSYNRQQVAGQISQIQSSATEEEQALDTKIANIQNDITSNESNWNKSCPQTNSEAECRAAVQEFENRLPSYSLNAHIEAYKNILPQLSAAIDQDLQAKVEGENKLSALDNEANNILRSAH
jgi:hypothetical protein